MAAAHSSVWSTHPLGVLRDEELWLHLPADTKQSNNVGMVQFVQHIDLSPEFAHILLVPGEQRLNYNQRLDLSITYPMSFCQEHIAVVTLAWKQSDFFLSKM